jgi:hypothetical protein
MPDFNLHRPDDDLVETELAAFGGFWQCQFHDTGPKPANGIDALASFNGRTPLRRKMLNHVIIVAHSYELKAIATKIQESGGDATRFWHARKLTLR